MKRKSDPEAVDAIVTFVMFRGECVAFFRAYKAPGEKEWSKTPERVKGYGRFSYRAAEGYVHNGQHGEYDAEILHKCRRATRKEYKPLLDELTNLVGYNVTLHQKGRLKLKGRK